MYGRAYQLLSRRKDEDGFLEQLFERNPLFIELLGDRPNWMK
jgi:hypothetical protein